MIHIITVYEDVTNLVARGGSNLGRKLLICISAYSYVVLLGTEILQTIVKYIQCGWPVTCLLCDARFLAYDRPRGNVTEKVLLQLRATTVKFHTTMRAVAAFLLVRLVLYGHIIIP